MTRALVNTINSSGYRAAALDGQNNFVVAPTTNNTYSSNSNNNPYGLSFDDLKPRFGIERVMIAGLAEIPDADGQSRDSTGKPGFYAINGLTGLPDKRIRLYGQWVYYIQIQTGAGSSGNAVYSGNSGDYITITGIYSKLNAVNYPGSNSVMNIYLNGTNTSNTFTSNGSTILSSIFVGANSVYPLNAGISAQNLYTVKLIKTDTNNSFIFGFEFVNDRNASTQEISIPSGTEVIAGEEVPFTALIGANSLNYKGSTNNGGQLYAGTKGARVSWFRKKDPSSTTNGLYVSKYTGVTEVSQTGTITYNAAASDTIVVTDTTPFYANSQGNIVRVKDGSSTNKMLLVPTGATSSILTFANDYDGVADTTLFAGNKQFQDDGITGATFGDGSSCTVELYAKVMANADHTNEELAREYHWRDFGVGRSDDIQTVPGSAATNRAFTLDDGCTSLGITYTNAFNGSSNQGFVIDGGANNFASFYFIGTGLDLKAFCTTAGAIDSHSWYLDGVLIYNTSAPGTTADLVYKIASDLPYGVHTLRIVYPTVTTANGLVYTGFRVYQPKTPVLTGYKPEFSYNILANYIATSLPTYSTSTAFIYAGQVDQGVIRKLTTREMVPVGTWFNTGVAINQVNFRDINTQTSGDTAAFTVYGDTNYRIWYGNGANTRLFQVSVDGGSYATVDTDGSRGCCGKFRTDMGTLGLHTLTFKAGGAQVYFEPQAFDYSTPIYEPGFWTTNPFLDYAICNTGVQDYSNSAVVTNKRLPREYFTNCFLADNTAVPANTSPLLIAGFVLDKGQWEFKYDASVQALDASGFYISYNVRVDGIFWDGTGSAISASGAVRLNGTAPLVLQKRSYVVFTMYAQATGHYNLRAAGLDSNYDRTPWIRAKKISDY